MIDPSTLIPSPQSAALSVYDACSRYLGIPLLEFTDADGATHVYVRRRQVPAAESLAALGTYTVSEGDRLDQIAASQFADPRWWWRIADGNGALDPAALTATPGARLRLTLPAGVPGPSQG
ncbi:LysM domain-containing protein [Paraburkholderia sp. JPY432]|uniref:LysM domain-containing protein n=1 Tax=Paraburkholderia youngii TaxID=2782701 RepID=UPI001595628B|nr:LysM domain-containing protein [Paraburkholderia youngii]NVH74225.1 LysM domain-containing protein [Paraburkholderia youngii]